MPPIAVVDPADRATTIDAVHAFAARVHEARPPATAALFNRARFAGVDTHLRHLTDAADDLESLARRYLTVSEAARLEHMLADMFTGGDHYLLAERTLDHELFARWSVSAGSLTDPDGWLRQPEAQDLAPFPDMPTLREVNSWEVDAGTAANRAQFASALTALALHTSAWARPAPGWNSATLSAAPAPRPRADTHPEWVTQLQRLTSTLRATLNTDPGWLTVGETARTERIFAALVHLEAFPDLARVFTLIEDASRFHDWARARTAGFGGLDGEQVFADMAYVAHLRTLAIPARGIVEPTGFFPDMPGLTRQPRLYPNITFTETSKTGLRAQITRLARAATAPPDPDIGRWARRNRIAERAEPILSACRNHPADTKVLRPGEIVPDAAKLRGDRVVALILTEHPLARTTTPEQLADAVFDAEVYERLVTAHNARVFSAQRDGLDIDPMLPAPEARHWPNALEAAGTGTAVDTGVDALTAVAAARPAPALTTVSAGAGSSAASVASETVETAAPVEEAGL